MLVEGLELLQKKIGEFKRLSSAACIFSQTSNFFSVLFKSKLIQTCCAF